MSFSLIRAALKVRRPLTCLTALTAMAFLTDGAFADADQMVQPQTTPLKQLSSSEGKIEFRPIPSLNSPVAGQNRFNKLEPIDVSSLQDLFGPLDKPEPKAGVSAKMLIPTPHTNESQSKPQVPSAPAESAVPEILNRVSLVTFNEPLSQQETPNRAVQTSDFQPLSNSRRRTARPPAPSLQPTVTGVVQASAVSSFPLTAYTNPKAFSGTYRIRNIDLIRFEERVVQIWGERLRASTTDDGRYVRVELPTNVGEQMTMVLDRQTETVSYEGREELKDNWHRIMERIDLMPQQMVDGSVLETKLIDISASPQSIRQVAFLTGMPQDRPIRSQVQLPGAIPAEALGGLAQQQEIPPGTQGIKNTVKIIQDPEAGILQLIGDPEDVAIIQKIILDISQKSNTVQPTSERIALNNLQSEAIWEQVQSLYDNSSYPSSKGAVQVQPLSSSNSLLVLGQKDAIDAVRKIVESMDVVPSSDSVGGFKAIRLTYISAADAALRLNTYFGQEQSGAGDFSIPSSAVTVIPDFRSNTVVVRGADQFIRQAEQFIKTIDVIDNNAAVNEVKVFPLRNTVAADMAIVIQDAINGQQQNSGLGANPNQQGQQNQTQNTQTDRNTSTLRSALLSLKTIGGSGQEIVGAIMFDVRVTADSNSNSLVVTGPKESMALIEALIYQLDRLPDAETLIKVFEIVNGDAETLLEMLEALFGSDQNTQQNQGGTNLSQLPLQGAAASDGQTLVNLRFSVDLRTNTIIASGPAGDLEVVEDLLNRLDAKETNDAPADVYRLSNAPAIDVADAINAWLEGVVDLAGADPRQNNGVSTSDRTVIVVPEAISNSLIVSARPEYRAEVEKIIRALDRRPPMVKVKVLIAEVDLTTLEEFGVELGLQDSLLFDRGTLVDAANQITDGSIGFPFNQTASNAGNLSAGGEGARGSLLGQGLSNLGTGRINSDLGYGGLVLSAGSDSANILIRALKDRQCVRVLSKPHIMTIENLQGRVSIGAEVPRVAGTNVSGVGNVTQDIEFVDVGVILEVTPRVSPDGMIVMAVNAKKSAVGPDATGITIGFGASGEPIIAPQIIETEANTTLMARSGQTVVFSGLIQETKTHVERGTPILSDLPVVGPLFKFESDEARRSELMIIMTPYLITDDEDINSANYDEMDRMHWCESDIAEVYGNTDYSGYQGDGGAVETYYPDADPSGSMPYTMQQGEFIDGPPVPSIDAIPQARSRQRSHQRAPVRQATNTPHYRGRY